MGSTRLPGKSLLYLGRYTLLDWVLLRILLVAQSKDIVLATTTSRNDKKLTDRAAELGIRIYRGSCTNVLGRFQEISNTFPEYERIIRVCADNPFVSPALLLQTEEFFNVKKMSYCHTLSKPPQFPYVDGMGVEIFKREILLQTEKMKATEFEQEHVTQIINRLSLRIDDLGMPTPPQYSYPSLKLDIDTVEDYISIRTLIESYGLSPTSSDEQILKSASLFFGDSND